MFSIAYTTKDGVFVSEEAKKKNVRIIVVYDFLFWLKVDNNRI